MAKYVKCGKNAFSFADPFTGFNIVKGEVKEISNLVASSGKVKSAIRGGHLESVSKSDYEIFLRGGVKEKSDEGKTGEGNGNSEKTLEEKLGEMTKSELSEYYQSEYEVDDKDIEEFEALKKDKMIQFLLSLEKEG